MEELEIREHTEKFVSSNSNPFETDETDCLDKAPTIGSNFDSVKDTETKTYLSQQTVNSESFSSLPSDSQILDDHYKTNFVSTNVSIDEALVSNNMENRSMTTSLQTCLESTQVTEDESKTAEEWNTLKVQETNDVRNKITAV